MHSKDFKNASKWKGKHGVVVGIANTGKLSLFVLFQTPIYIDQFQLSRARYR